jgi:hypothetical protein
MAPSRGVCCLYVATTVSEILDTGWCLGCGTTRCCLFVMPLLRGQPVRFWALMVLELSHHQMLFVCDALLPGQPVTFGPLAGACLLTLAV